MENRGRLGEPHFEKHPAKIRSDQQGGGRGEGRRVHKKKKEILKEKRVTRITGTPQGVRKDILRKKGPVAVYS